MLDAVVELRPEAIAERVAFIGQPAVLRAFVVVPQCPRRLVEAQPGATPGRPGRPQQQVVRGGIRGGGGGVVVVWWWWCVVVVVLFVCP